MKHIININVFFNPEEVEVGDEIEVEGGELEAPEIPEDEIPEAPDGEIEMPEAPDAPEVPEIPAEDILDDEGEKPAEEIEAQLLQLENQMIVK